MIRLADRFAAWFLPLSLAHGRAGLVVSGSAVRAVAVLVVATPCPLLLAAPVAIVSGLSRASRRGVVIRSGGALENLGRAQTMVLDKTGTLTAGRPAVIEVAAAPGRTATEVLRLAASADQLSPHVLAEAIVAEARTARAARCRCRPMSRRNRAAASPPRSTAHGCGSASGTRTRDAAWARAVGQPGRAGRLPPRVGRASTATPVGAVLLRDPLRRDASRTLRRLRAAGIQRLVMLTGDRPEPAREVGTVLGLDEVRAEQTPAEQGRRAYAPSGERAVTVMVGDGINDAPALAAATVGVAMGARGATASSEAADVVLTTDRLDRLADAMEIARRARRIAVQSAAGRAWRCRWLAMAVAAFGLAAARGRGAAAGGHRRRGDPQRAARAAAAARSAAGRVPADTEDAAAPLRGRARRTARHHRAAARRRRSPCRRRRPRLRWRHWPAAHAFLTDGCCPTSRAEETQLYPALAAPSAAVRRPRR